ncbi:MAG: IclR family transcriptional regulator [Desulfarculaceae bacterium]|nr:IclR family transcriptional regulator [Desulfarculaceae bacterium]MCF8072453.1 IclR family transcriptional regulator [Desulfarculaceae bacterium]MCF8102914.1 IclR family transcriptional regulator [Desulfarculaceae bacterium]MCF8117483.1 IclR family transcriptional regulator [Desulfarculaceae bacterium]
MAVKKVEALKKGLQVLHVLATHGPSLKLQEITQLSGLPKATVYRLLQTLIDQEYVHYFSDTTTFRPGPKVMSLGYAALSGLDLAEVSEPYLRELSVRIGQNVNLGILDGTQVVYIIRVKARRILGIDLTVGSRLSSHNSAIGQALLAYLDPESLDRVVAAMAADPQMAGEIGPGGAALRQKLAEVRQRGYALSEGEFQTGLSSVAVPVIGGGGVVEGALNLPVFSQMTSREELLDKYLPELSKTSQVISTLRGHRPAASSE